METRTTNVSGAESVIGLVEEALYRLYAHKVTITPAESGYDVAVTAHFQPEGPGSVLCPEVGQSGPTPEEACSRWHERFGITETVARRQAFLAGLATTERGPS